MVVPNDPDRCADANWHDDSIWSNDTNMPPIKSILERINGFAE